MGSASSKQGESSYKDHSQAIETALNNYKSYNFNGLLSMMKTLKIDKSLAEQIGKQHQLLVSSLTTEQLNEMNDSHFQMFINGLTEKAIYKNAGEFLDKNKVLREIDQNNNGVVTRVYNTLSDLFRKYKFFEYKYVQTNLFMLILIQEVQSLMDKYLMHCKAYVRDMEVKYQQDIGQALKILDDLKDSNNIPIEQINKFNNQIMTSVKESKQMMETTIQNLDESNKLIPTLNSLLEKDTVLYNQVKTKINSTAPMQQGAGVKQPHKRPTSAQQQQSKAKTQLPKRVQPSVTRTKRSKLF